MEFEGKVWKSKNHWLVEIPSLDLMTQGATKKETLAMIKEVSEELLEYYFGTKSAKNCLIDVNTYQKGVIFISGSKKKLFLALSLRRQREKSHSTIRETAKRLGTCSPNGYA